MAVGRLHAAVGLERSGRGVHERGTCPERVPERLTKKRLKNVHIGLSGLGRWASKNRALVALGGQGTWKSFLQRCFFPWCRGV